MPRAEVIRRYRDLAAECWAAGGPQTDPHEWNSAQVFGATLERLANDLEKADGALPSILVPDVHGGEVFDAHGLEVHRMEGQGVPAHGGQRGRVQAGVRGGR